MLVFSPVYVIMRVLFVCSLYPKVFGEIVAVSSLSSIRYFLLFHH